MIAIVDDDKLMHKVYANIFEGNNLRFFEHGKEFVQEIELGYLPEVLILDAVMPYMHGLDVIHYLQREGIEIPTVLVTSYEGADYELLALQNNVDYIHKDKVTILRPAVLGWFERVRSGK